MVGKKKLEKMKMIEKAKTQIPPSKRFWEILEKPGKKHGDIRPKVAGVTEKIWDSEEFYKRLEEFARTCPMYPEVLYK